MTLLAFSHPDLFTPLARIYFVCLLVLFFLFLGALFRHRWKDTAILVVILAIALNPFYVRRGSPLFRWLYAEAFRIHASPIDRYLAQCQMIWFVEQGVEQKLGRCETLVIGNETIVDVFYDTTGEFVLPLSQRTPEWKAAMSHFSPQKLLINQQGRASELFGNFYQITIGEIEFDGDDERYWYAPTL